MKNAKDLSGLSNHKRGRKDRLSNPAPDPDGIGPFSPPVRESLADKIVEQIREAIVRGRFAAGEQLRVAPLAEFLGVSQGPIREALSRLEREGLVVMRPNRTALVARLTRQDLEEVYSLRIALERLAMQYTIRNVNKDDLSEMQSLVDLMVKRVTEGISEKEAADLDLQFHDIVYRASRHKRLLSWWADLRPQIYLFLLSRNVADTDFRGQMIGHQDIVNVIRDGDETRAVSCIENHVRVAYDRISRSYER